MNSLKWIKNEGIYTLEDSNKKALLVIEDRTCNGNFVTKEILERYASEYFEEFSTKLN